MNPGDRTALTEARERAVRSELDRLIESAAFRTSKRCREFLRYVVERTISGPADTLKERSIGVDLFQLPPDFDTGQHTIVRVTANEVRKKLAQQYQADNGTARAVRIELPPGSYSADFRWEDPVEAAAPPETPAAGRPHWLAGALIGSGVVVAAVLTLLWWRGSAKTVVAEPRAGVAAAAVVRALPGGGDVRLMVGATNPYIDRSGRTWAPDRFFSGGVALGRPSERIFRTLDPDLYRRFRQGDFQYDIPLDPGAYELHLHFAETGLADFVSAESSGEGQRLFRVAANGKVILDQFDVVADAAGANIADERVFRDISPAPDGRLHLSFASMRSTAMVSAIELIPMKDAKTLPVRIRAGWPAAWQDAAGQQWRADSYFLGGNALVRNTNPVRSNDAPTPDMAVYTSERWGHFSYAVPVADGRYKVTLKFCEGHYGRRNTGVGGQGSRLFDVYSNGVALLRNFDISKEAGGEGRPIDRTFSGLRPTAQGKMVLTFVPVVGMACVNGIEVSEE
ncbi:MAG: hypothetical protein JSU00_26500 [Acidobacteria bacterium]|nr:hypothetical protein [Acidobacteriota bacterium]